MTQDKSPFFVVEDFLSPKQADYIVDTLNILEPDTNKDDVPVKSTRFNHHCESLVFNQLESVRDQIQEYYGFTWKGTEQMTFEFYPEACANASEPVCGNATYVGRKWMRTRNRDFTGIIFLSDYNDAHSEKFDPSFEVYGGKLQFPQYNFSFNPKRGTMVIFPANERFINVVGRIDCGDLYMVRFHICADKLWPYDPKQYPGSYKTWFN